MAIYIRTRPTTKTRALGCLCALTTVGMTFLYPTAILLAPSIANPLTEPVVNDDGNLALQSLSVLIGVATVYSFILIAMIFGAFSGFMGMDQWLPKDATVTHRDIASARFLHISQSPSRRAVGMLWAMLAVILIEVNAVITITILHLLILSDSNPALEQVAVIGMACLIIGLILVLASAASRREKIAVCMTPQGMAVFKPFPSALPLPSGRNNLSIQEVPALWGRVKVQAVYSPPTGGAEPGRPVVIPRLGLTVRPSRLDDARSRVEARLDEVWRAAQLIRASIEQEETADAPPSEAEPKLAYQPPHQDAAPATTSPRQRPLSHE
nr:hypothetical protein [Actinomyces oris]